MFSGIFLNKSLYDVQKKLIIVCRVESALTLCLKTQRDSVQNHMLMDKKHHMRIWKLQHFYSENVSNHESIIKIVAD